MSPESPDPHARTPRPPAPDASGASVRRRSPRTADAPARPRAGAPGPQTPVGARSAGPETPVRQRTPRAAPRGADPSAEPPRTRPAAPGEAPAYRRYRAKPRLRLPGRHEDALGVGLHDGPRTPGRRHITPRRVIAIVAGLIAAWLLLSVLVFMVSSHFERISPPANVAAALDPGGSLLTSANNILVLGSDQRPANSKEGGAHSQASRSDTMMLIRTGGGASARLSIPRDTVVDIPGHGLQKINAAYAFGGPALAIRVVKAYLGVPVNHLVIVNFGSFPSLVDAMGGVTYTGGCINSNISGGVANGGQTLVLPAGTHHLTGEQALVLARTRHNACNPGEDDLGRERAQQALFQDMQHQLESPSTFLRLPWVAWNAPPAIISDMSGPTLLQLFGALAIGGSAPTRQLLPSGNVLLPDGEEGLSVSAADKQHAVAQFMQG